ncbi:MAG: hypothetical protein ABW034_03815 [Steroidobacteraceae bacterium]
MSRAVTRSRHRGFLGRPVLILKSPSTSFGYRDTFSSYNFRIPNSVMASGGRATLPSMILGSQVTRLQLLPQ